MSERKTPRQPEGRTLYVGHFLTPAEVNEVCRACGLFVMDVQTTPTDQELRAAVRELVREALAARIRRQARRVQED